MEYKCSVCGNRVQGDLLVYIDHTQGHIVETIKAKHPEWTEKDGLCPKCVDYYKKELKGN